MKPLKEEVFDLIKINSGLTTKDYALLIFNRTDPTILGKVSSAISILKKQGKIVGDIKKDGYFYYYPAPAEVTKLQGKTAPPFNPPKILKEDPVEEPVKKEPEIKTVLISKDCPPPEKKDPSTFVILSKRLDNLIVRVETLLDEAKDMIEEVRTYEKRLENLQSEQNADVAAALELIQETLAKVKK